MVSSLALGALLLFAAVAPQAGAPAPPRTVPSVDPAKFAGTYYEIARIPNRFQEKCAGDVTATYAPRRDGRIDVVNRCRTRGGTIDEARGIAKAPDQDRSYARLKVRFAPGWLSLVRSVWGDYWVLGVGPDYSYVVVGDPERKYLWILSRLAHMPDLAYRQSLEIVTSNGYDARRLVRTLHGQ